MDGRQPGPIKSVLLVIIGWLFGWLVGNAVFSETTLRIFLIFWISQLGIEEKKIEKNSWFGDICENVSKLAQNQALFFLKTAQMIFWVFGLKLVLNITFNLNETYFSEKFAIWRYLTSKLLKFGCFLTIRSSSQCILDHNKIWVFIVFSALSFLWLNFYEEEMPVRLYIRVNA